MKDMLKITLSLVAIFVVAGLIMGLTYRYTYPVRFQAEKKEKEEALKEMAPEATDPIKQAGDWTANNKPYEYFEATSSGKPVAHSRDASLRATVVGLRVCLVAAPGAPRARWSGWV